MKPNKEKEFYIVCDYQFSDSEQRMLVAKPVFLYEDGTLEVESVGKFADRTHPKYCRQWYDGIKEDMKELNNPERDLRQDFCPNDYRATIIRELLLRYPDKKCFSRAELEALIQKRNIEARIHSASERIRKLINRRKLGAMKRRSEEDIIFLKKIGE